jgi:sterol desaturase/sphingolipid hydroxylase (fatty acid hydroxylase superfamily)
MATQTHQTPESPHPRSETLKASPPLFRSPFLDRFTRVHHLVPVFIFGPVVLVCLVLAFGRQSVPAVLGLVVVGYLLWTLTEYWLHRVVFHFEPENGIGARLHFLIHGVHHDHPNDPKRLVMPPAASLPLAVLFVLAFRAVFGADGWPAVTAGFLGGYLVYDEMHYWLHHHVPTSKLGKRLRELHMRHHFQDDTVGFGISAPYWDKVFGTFPGRRRRG